MTKESKVVVGSPKICRPTDKEMTCEDCGKNCYFSDNWNFDVMDKVICLNCYLEKYQNKKGIKIGVHEETIKNIAKIKGIEEWESNLLVRKIMDKSGEKKELIITKDKKLIKGGKK
jgi:hypothetical protein